MRRFLTLFSVFALLSCSLMRAQCGVKNTAFRSGELLGYDLYFNWNFVWVKVGTASFSTRQTNYQGKPALCTSLLTSTSKKADSYFVMRDTLTSYMGLDLMPKYYRKRATEGKDYRCEDVWYSYSDGKCNLRMRFRKNKRQPEQRSHSDKYCAFDMVSMMMRARTFDAKGYGVGHRIPFLMAEGKRCEWRNLIYHGKETVKMQGSKMRYRCLVFSYVERQKNGKEKEIIRFYVTDDANHVPVLLDMKLNFGSAKAYLRSASGLRNSEGARS